MNFDEVVAEKPVTLFGEGPPEDHNELRRGGPMTANRGILAVLLFLIVAAFTGGEMFAASCKDTPLGEGQKSAADFAVACTETAFNQPYKFAWLLLAKICDLDSDPDSKKPVPCEWQGWATNNQTFPAKPSLDSVPKWPAEGPWPIDDKAKFETSCADDLLMVHHVLERRRNRPGFEYIIDNDLWYREGLITAYVDNQSINSPQNAVDVAVTWKEIQSSEVHRYHWKVLPNGTICGLTTLDVKSRIFPNWFFFAFDHVDNPGRCDYSGCRDDFGQMPAFIKPKFEPSTTMYIPQNNGNRPTYDAGHLTEALENLIEINPMWKANYRLTGVQTEFVTADGKPTILAGSQIEGRAFPASSSCITCHSRAGFNSQGEALEEMGALGVSPNGAPDPSWFYDQGPDGWQLRYKQCNSLWALPKNACPLSCTNKEFGRLPERCCKHQKEATQE